MNSFSEVIYKMDAKELTKKFYEKDKELTELRKRVSDLEDTVRRLNMKVNDLTPLEGAVDNLKKQIRSL